MILAELLEKTVTTNASDLHLIAGIAPNIRVDGRLIPLSAYPPLSNEEIQNLVFSILTPEQKELFLTNRSLDFSYGYGGGDYGEKGRFRINLYFQRNTVAAAFRLLPPKVKTIEELRLPPIAHNFAKIKQGFVLVTGPTGHGKSTTLASIVNEINMNQAANIITIEDPIEYVYPKGKGIISQREIGIDSLSWAESLRSALREDPDVVLIGEMRDPESIASAITMAETGHLVFSTLHTNSASQTIDRIIDSFPEKQQNQIKAQLAGSLQGIISQRLIPKIDGGRIVASEVMIANNAIKSNVREGKTHLIDSTIETSQDIGMISLEASLAALVKQGLITLETARSYVLRQEAFNQLIV
ncbi:MAG: twitching motility protein [Candidatus Levybacteria bacterium GW2011_GWB1_39_7]|nr:MAG: twitching motility protein [Candidatus Levybacteria bacterium GW2011_GWA1_39_11]KKR25308.1 MAG: twitching motility protein [Candidatus Levybacteria bacterium GW2011_GWB1_39_7]KKR27581.1 MAG: twitching motility protein [Microgenomates group bacterium GW2011_GWC1_39_7]KKR50445.1 MAG: twitching motility protein [Candidatus Levybacteria bacterium GW2011_GWA2_40_16]